MFWVIQCFSEDNVPRRIGSKTTTPNTIFVNSSFTSLAFFWHEGVIKDTGFIIRLWGGGGGSSWGDSVGGLAQAHCHCWRRGQAGELGDRCWMWKPVWLISNRVEGGGTLLCLAVSLQPTQSVAEGSSGLQPGWQWRPCRRNGCDYRPGGAFFSVCVCVCELACAYVQMRRSFLW